MKILLGGVCSEISIFCARNKLGRFSISVGSIRSIYFLRQTISCGEIKIIATMQVSTVRTNAATFNRKLEQSMIGPKLI